jgi:DNA-binding PadR family transcriptional regulator
MARQRRGPEGLARFGEPGFLVLVSLSDGPKHGYAIAEDVLDQTGIRLGPGTLYGSLAKLVQRGLIVPMRSDSRRRPYKITNLGRTALDSHLSAWMRILETATARLQQAARTPR